MGGIIERLSQRLPMSDDSASDWISASPCKHPLHYILQVTAWTGRQAAR